MVAPLYTCSSVLVFIFYVCRWVGCIPEPRRTSRGAKQWLASKHHFQHGTETLPPASVGFAGGERSEQSASQGIRFVPAPGSGGGAVAHTRLDGHAALGAHTQAATSWHQPALLEQSALLLHGKSDRVTGKGVCSATIASSGILLCSSSKLSKLSAHKKGQTQIETPTRCPFQCRVPRGVGAQRKRKHSNRCWVAFQLCLYFCAQYKSYLTCSGCGKSWFVIVRDCAPCCKLDHNSYMAQNHMWIQIRITQCR